MLLTIGDGACKENQQHVFLQYLDVIRPIDLVDWTLGCVCLRCHTDERLLHSLEQVSSCSEHRRLHVME